MALHSILPLVKRAFDAINDVSILSDKTGRNFLRAQLGSNFLGAYLPFAGSSVGTIEVCWKAKGL